MEGPRGLRQVPPPQCLTFVLGLREMLTTRAAACKPVGEAGEEAQRLRPPSPSDLPLGWQPGAREDTPHPLPVQLPPSRRTGRTLCLPLKASCSHCKLS